MLSTCCQHVVFLQNVDTMLAKCCQHVVFFVELKNCEILYVMYVLTIIDKCCGINVGKMFAKYCLLQNVGPHASLLSPTPRPVPDKQGQSRARATQASAMNHSQCNTHECTITQRARRQLNQCSWCCMHDLLNTHKLYKKRYFTDI